MRNFYTTLIISVFASLAGSGCEPVDTTAPQTAQPSTPEYEGRDGNFSAILMPIDVKDIKEFDKGEHEGPNLVFKTRAVHGDKIALKVVFMGMELTDEMHADVTYDLQVLAPDNAIYTGADVKGVQALKGKVLRPKNVFNSPATMVLRFESKDRLGPYKVTATVRDNIGNRKVLLKHKIELEEKP